MASGSVIGALRVNLGLDSAQFQSGVRGANKHIADLRKRFLAVATTAAAVGGALTALTIKTSQTAAEIQRFAQVANAAPEELQKWAAGSRTVGIEQEKLADILKDVNDRVGDFLTTGGGPMADFFEKVAPKIGLTADAFRDLSGPQALQLYVSSLEKAGLSQQEMTFYLEAMASDATALIPLLKDGGAEMARLAANADSLGGIMKDSTVASLAALKLAMLDAGTAIQGVGYRISGELAPALTAIAEAFANAMREGSALRTGLDFLIANIDTLISSLGVLVGFFGLKLVAAMALSAGATGILSGAFIILQKAIFATGFGALIIGAGFLVAKFSELVRSAGGFGKALGLLKDVAIGVWEKIKAGAAVMYYGLALVFNDIEDAWIRTIGKLATNWGRFVDSIAGTSIGEMMGIDGGNEAEAIGNMASSMEANTNAMESIINKMNAAASIATGPTSGMKELRDMMAQTAIETDGAADSARGLASELDQMAGGSGPGGAAAVGKVTEAVDTLKERMEATKNTMQSAFTGLVTGAKSLRATLADLLSSFAEMFANRAFQSFWSGATSGGGGGLVGSLLGAIPGFATGTNNFSGGLATINERGGELVNLPNGSQVIPHDISKRIADRNGGTVINQTINIAGSKTNSELNQMIGSAMEQANAQIRREVPGLVMRQQKVSG